jgi:hypothetical protein
MQKFDHYIGFWEKRQFFAENCRKSPKIVIITSTPSRTSRVARFFLTQYTKKREKYTNLPQQYETAIKYTKGP